MAAGEGVPSFDEMIQAGKASKLSKKKTWLLRERQDRLRRKNEALANEILGKGRKASNSAGVGKRKAGAGASLASRVGVTKVCNLGYLQ